MGVSENLTVYRFDFQRYLRSAYPLNWTLVRVKMLAGGMQASIPSKGQFPLRTGMRWSKAQFSCSLVRYRLTFLLEQSRGKLSKGIFNLAAMVAPALILTTVTWDRSGLAKA